MKTIYQTLSSSLSLLFFLGQKSFYVFSRAWEKRIVDGDGVELVGNRGFLGALLAHVQ